MTPALIVFQRDQLRHLFVSDENGTLACSFARPRLASTRLVNRSADHLDYVTMDFDLNNDYYLMLAWGKVMKGKIYLSNRTNPPFLCILVILSQIRYTIKLGKFGHNLQKISNM